MEKILTELASYSAVHMPGCKWTVIETYRPQSRQDALFAKGRTAPGRIVTKTRSSRHTLCLAFDIVPFANGQPLWNADKRHWAYLGHLARKHGLVWGGDWDSDGSSDDESFVDSPHVEWPRSDLAMTRAAIAWRDRQPWFGSIR